MIRFLAVYALLAAALPWTAFAQQSPDPPHPDAERLFQEEKMVPVKEGKDRCIVCGKLLEAGAAVYMVEGQRVGVLEEMKPNLFSDPWRYLAKLRPRGGLFGGETTAAASDFWIFLGLYAILGLAFAGLSVHRAINDGRSPLPWLFAGLFFNFVGYALLLFTQGKTETRIDPKYAGVVKTPLTAEPLECPQCGSSNHPAADRCSHCGSALEPQASSEAALARSAR